MPVKRSSTAQTAATNAAQAPSPKRTRRVSSQHQDGNRNGNTVADNGSDDSGSESDSDAESSSSVSSSEDEDDSSDASEESENEEIEDTDAVVSISGRAKPQMRLPRSKPSTGDQDLRSRLSTFLPQLAAANAELEQLAQSGGLEGKRIEDVDEGAEGGYIEMELGLGVLEEKREGGSDGDDADEEDEEGEDEDDHLGRLMGQVRKGQNLGIQEVDGK